MNVSSATRLHSALLMAMTLSFRWSRPHGREPGIDLTLVRRPITV
jgi:hypothetical protein